MNDPDVKERRDLSVSSNNDVARQVVIVVER